MSALLTYFGLIVTPKSAMSEAAARLVRPRRAAARHRTALS
jgi:hypothetical protein